MAFPTLKKKSTNYAHFVSVMSSSLTQPPDEDAAASLWSILDGKGLTGSRVGNMVKEVPIGEDNVGRRMLLAMGWDPLAGLGRDGGGATAPVPAGNVKLGKAGVGYRGRRGAAGLAPRGQNRRGKKYGI